jgi:Pretoxin HINT domain
VAGTEVLTPDGVKSIEDIEVGDWVIADDPTTVGEIEAKRVLELFSHTDYQLLDLVVDRETISVTPNHEFWVVDRGWVNAEDLGIGDRLWTDDGRSVDVDGVTRREGSFQVYNFEVDGFHSYFVSDWGVLVHNACSPYTNKTIEELVKSKASYQDLIEEHQKKLQDYIANPDAYDNQGILANTPNTEIRQKIIEGRIKALQKQIDKQKGELQKINSTIQERGSK